MFLCVSMNFHPDKQLFQVAGIGDRLTDLWIKKPVLYPYSMGDPLNCKDIYAISKQIWLHCHTRVSPNFVGEEWNFMHLRNNELIPICQCPLHSMDFKAKPLFLHFLTYSQRLDSVQNDFMKVSVNHPFPQSSNFSRIFYLRIEEFQWRITN